GVQGWMLQRTGWLERAMLIAAGLLLMHPARASDRAGLVLVVVAAAIQWWKRRVNSLRRRR
ncbi:MAG TPA: hypothetical protein VN177_09470, partial [Myxococcales bacterium]|nr:hypothetical protein [Myxococcales bacterium]